MNTVSIQQRLDVCYFVNYSDAEVFKKSLLSIRNCSYKNLSLSFYAGNNRAAEVLTNESIKNVAMTFSPYSFYPADINLGVAWQSLLNKCRNEIVLFVSDSTIVSEDTIQKYYNKITARKNCGLIRVNDFKGNFAFAICRVRMLRRVAGFHKKYNTCNIAIEDISERLKRVFGYDAITKIDNSVTANSQLKYDDEKIFDERKADKRFDRKIIYVEEALGDHVCALTLINEVPDVTVCCKYPQVFEGNKNVSGFIAWDDKLFGENGFNLYEHGMHTDKYSMKEGYCSAYGYRYDPENFRFDIPDDYYRSFKEKNKFDNYVLIAPEASTPTGVPSNKLWQEEKWIEIVDYLKQLGYQVYQTGTASSKRIENTDGYIFDATPINLACFLEDCKFWISLDTYMHHLASAIGKKGICLTPANNEHAYHSNNIYISRPSEGIKLNPRWYPDAEQPERAFSMMNIQAEDVKEAIKEVDTSEIKYRPLEI